MALKCVLIFLTITCFLANNPSARELPKQLGFNPTAARLEANGNLVDCWNSVREIKSCANEIVAFFRKGKADIGPPCCRAISMITHQCWPAMLTALGFTPDQCYILHGYCGAISSSTPATTPSQQPTPAKMV